MLGSGGLCSEPVNAQCRESESTKDSFVGENGFDTV
jgi:hypothetical protein